MTKNAPTLTQPASIESAESTQPEGAGSALLVDALERVWAEIQQRHPDVPAVVVTVGAGSIGARPGTLRLGHYAAARWRPVDADRDGQALAELFVGGEGLAHGAVDVLGTLLHEAAHGVAYTRGVKDTSRAGAYHNARFKTLAEELGLTIDRDPRIGWSLTTVPAATVDAYRAEIDALRRAIVHVRASEHEPAPCPTSDAGEGAEVEPVDEGSSRSAPTYLCECPKPRRLRMAPTVFDAAPVLCGACRQPFAEAD